MYANGWIVKRTHIVYIEIQLNRFEIRWWWTVCFRNSLKTSSHCACAVVVSVNLIMLVSLGNSFLLIKLFLSWELLIFYFKCDQNLKFFAKIKLNLANIINVKASSARKCLCGCCSKSKNKCFYYRELDANKRALRWNESDNKIVPQSKHMALWQYHLFFSQKKEENKLATQPNVQAKNEVRACGFEIWCAPFGRPNETQNKHNFIEISMVFVDFFFSFLVVWDLLCSRKSPINN